MMKQAGSKAGDRIKRGNPGKKAARRILFAVLLSIFMTGGAFAAEKAESDDGTAMPSAAEVPSDKGESSQEKDAAEKETEAEAGQTPRSMEHCIVKLDRYLTIYDGTAQDPQVLSVFYQGDPEDVDSDDGKVQYRKGTSAELQPEDYTVTYWNAQGEQLEEIHGIGEYTVTVSGKGRYEGSTSVLFSVFGKPQKITAAKTSYKLYTDSKAVQLSVRADGDGSGFRWRSGDPAVAEVSESGLVQPKAAGRTIIYVETTGNRISQPAKLRITVVVRAAAAAQLYTKRSEMTCAQVSWSEAEGADAYEILYGTKKDFKNGTCKSVISEKNALFAELDGLQKGQEYCVRIRGLSYVKDRRGNAFLLKGRWSATETIAAYPRSVQFADYFAYVLKMRADLFD